MGAQVYITAFSIEEGYRVTQYSEYYIWENSAQWES